MRIAAKWSSQQGHKAARPEFSQGGPDQGSQLTSSQSVVLLAMSTRSTLLGLWCCVSVWCTTEKTCEWEHVADSLSFPLLNWFSVESKNVRWPTTRTRKQKFRVGVFRSVLGRFQQCAVTQIDHLEVCVNLIFLDTSISCGRCYWKFGWSVASWTHKKNKVKNSALWTFQNTKNYVLTPNSLRDPGLRSWRSFSKRDHFS